MKGKTLRNQFSYNYINSNSIITRTFVLDTRLDIRELNILYSRHVQKTISFMDPQSTCKVDKRVPFGARNTSLALKIRKNGFSEI